LDEYVAFLFALFSARNRYNARGTATRRKKQDGAIVIRLS
jgi:hypothetical protein